MTRESELMLEFQKGNKEAFYQLVEPHLKKAYRTAFTILHSHFEAEDAVQNSLLEVYQNLTVQKEIYQFGGWFHRLVVHRSLDLCRRKLKESERKTTREVLPLLSSHDPSPVDRLIDSEQYDELLDYILKLTIHQRTVIVLYYFQEYSIEEIAELLGIKEGTVKSRLYHARIQLGRFYMSDNREEVR